MPPLPCFVDLTQNTHNLCKKERNVSSIEKLPDLTWSSLSLVFLGDSVLLTNVDLDKRLHISWQGLIAAEIVQHC